MELTGQMCYNLGSNKSVLATALTVPGRDDHRFNASGRKRDCTSRLFLLPGQRGNKMDNLITQGELFPEDSKYHSRYSLKKRLSARAIEASNSKQGRGRPVKDIKGVRFGMLVVIRQTAERCHNQSVWLCRCDCGHTIKATGSHLKRKVSPLDHCGCMGVDKTGNPKPGTRGIGGFNSTVRTSSNPTKAFSALWGSYRHSATIRGHKWNLDKQQFLNLTQGDCYYCGSEPAQVYRSSNHKFTYNGVDRLDSDKSYTPDNCVSCCGECNIAKGDRAVGDFLDWIERVYKHQQNGELNNEHFSTIQSIT